MPKRLGSFCLVRLEGGWICYDGESETTIGSDAVAALKVIFSGHVQGVGFRYRTRQIAARFPVSGYVKNLSNGNVELVAEGDENVLNTFLDAVRSNMAANIRNYEVEHPAESGYRSFDFAL